jgi:two-component system, OmpR family, sensor histidine kinase VicK
VSDPEVPRAKPSIKLRKSKVRNDSGFFSVRSHLPESTPSIQPDLAQPDLSQQDLINELALQRQRVALFSEVTLKIRQSLHLSEILATTVHEVQRILKADRVLVYQVLADGTGCAISEAVLPEYPAILHESFPEEVFPREYQVLYARGRVRAITDVADPEAGVSDCLVAFTSQFGVRSKLIVPILKIASAYTPDDARPSAPLWGLVIAHHCREARVWSEFELDLMQQLANHIAIAISHSQLLRHLEDIVEVRTADLRRSEEQLRLITNGLPVLIAYIDTEQRYQFNNQAYSAWLDQPIAQLQGMTLKAVWGEHNYQRMQPYLQQVMAGSQVSYESDISLPDGRLRSVGITYIPHVDDTGKVKGFFGLMGDISDRKAMERMKDEFISVVSHELRTPLTSLHSALKILATGRLGQLTSDGQQMLVIADENTDRLVRLVNNVLDLQRIEAGAVSMEMQTCPVGELLTQAVEAMQAMAQHQGVELMITQPVAGTVEADPDYIVQVLTNLISNAIKFSNPGTTIWIEAEPAPEQICFCVQDQGPGIPEDKLDLIFERFLQVDSSDSRKKGGTGLGLAICRKIIEQHHGKIWVESRLGEGSRFCFTLPLSAVTEPIEP